MSNLVRLPERRVMEPTQDPEEGRQRHMMIAFGTNGMGKSWLLEQMMRQFAKSNPDAPILGIQKRGRWGGHWVRGADMKPDLLYPWIRRVTNDGMGPHPKGPNPVVGMKGGFLFFDDIDGWAKRSTMGTPLHAIWTEHRHMRLDVGVTAHRPEDIDKTMIACAHYIFVFNTGETYAIKYLSGLDALKQSNLLELDPPREKGECIKISKDPDDPSSVKAVRLNLYKPQSSMIAQSVRLSK